MKDDLGLKLIAITGMTKMKLYLAKGLKIIEELDEIDLHSEKHHRGDKRQSSYQKKSGPGSLFEPHTTPKDLEHQEAARAISGVLDKLTSESRYREIIIAAEPRMLGFIRRHLSSHIKKLEPTEINKDLLHFNKSELEEMIFAK